MRGAGAAGLIVTSRRICANYSRYLIADVASETILVATRTTAGLWEPSIQYEISSNFSGIYWILGKLGEI